MSKLTDLAIKKLSMRKVAYSAELFPKDQDLSTAVGTVGAGLGGYSLARVLGANRLLAALLGLGSGALGYGFLANPKK